MNEKQFQAFAKLNNLFVANHFKLFFVGGTVRDYLLGLELTDLDVVSDATPTDMEKFLPNADYTFKRFGSVKLLYEGFKFDITTLRIEAGYVDSRHPNAVLFTNKLEEDVLRRDFKINALYLDVDKNVYDYVDGQNDIKNHLISMVGDPEKRIKEDPLRIFRAVRFMINLDFQLEDNLKKAIVDNAILVKKLNPQKIEEEVHKSHNPKKFKEYLNSLGVLW